MGADHDAYFEEVEARFESAHDLDLGLEEEFHVLDRETLALTGAFEALRDSAPPRLRERIAGELLTLGDRGVARRARCTSGRRRSSSCSTAPSCSRTPTRRATPSAPPARTPSRAGRTSRSSTRRTTGWSRTASSTSPGATTPGRRTCTSACAAATSAVAVCDALRTYLPHLLALSANSPFIEDVWTQLHSARTQTFVRMFPRCGIPDVFGTWAEHRALLRGARRHQLHPGVHADLVVGAAAPPLRHRRGAHLRRADRGVAEPRHLVAHGRA